MTYTHLQVLRNPHNVAFLEDGACGSAAIGTFEAIGLFKGSIMLPFKVAINFRRMRLFPLLEEPLNGLSHFGSPYQSF
ncbi:MAG: hypothetical protein ACO3MV_05350 [Flavobacteriales bacterium]